MAGGDKSKPPKQKGKSPTPHWISYKNPVSDSFSKSSTAKVIGALQSPRNRKEKEREGDEAQGPWAQAKAYTHALKREQCTPFNCFCKWGYSCFRIWTSPQYWCDWLILILLALAVMLMSTFWAPYEREFFEDDLTISYSYEEDVAIDDGVLFAVTIGIAIPTIIIVQCWTRSLKDCHRATLGVLQAFIITLFFGYIIKNSAGKLRPHFLDVCQPVGGECTGDEDEIEEARRSFPSLHSGGSMATFGFLTFYLIGKIQPFGPHRYFWKMVVAFAPLFSAALVAITRYEEYHHDPYDIAAGLSLGLMFAFLIYHQHYPSIFAATDHPVLPLKRRKYEQRLPIFNPKVREYRLKNIRDKLKRDKLEHDKDRDRSFHQGIRFRTLHKVPGLAATLNIPLSDIESSRTSGPTFHESSASSSPSSSPYSSSSEEGGAENAPSKRGGGRRRSGKPYDVEEGGVGAGDEDGSTPPRQRRKRGKDRDGRKKGKKKGKKRRRKGVEEEDLPERHASSSTAKVVVFSSPHSSEADNSSDDGGSSSSG